MTVGWKFPCRKQKNIAEQIRRSNKLLVATTSRYCIFIRRRIQSESFHFFLPPLCVCEDTKINKANCYARSTDYYWQVLEDQPG